MKTLKNNYKRKKRNLYKTLKKAVLFQATYLIKVQLMKRKTIYNVLHQKFLKRRELNITKLRSKLLKS